MKAVDLVVELPTDILFIEIKDFHAPDDYNFTTIAPPDERNVRRERLKHLRDVLTHKFRDTWLYNWAQRPANSPDKPVRYLCVLTLDNAMVSIVGKDLRQHLPTGNAGPRWQRPLATSCLVLNPARWACVFPAWPMKRV
ncbi:MAG: hypothetical protein C0445_16670 [Polaromonas sp.]|nr:hypothetical protein [Polaromonas sp.]